MKAESSSPAGGAKGEDSAALAFSSCVGHRKEACEPAAALPLLLVALLLATAVLAKLNSPARRGGAPARRGGAPAP